MVGKKVGVILSLLVVTSLAEKKINLEDIERDNLRTDTKSSSGNVRPGENSQAGTDRPENSREEYQTTPQRYHNDGNSVGYGSEQLPEKYVVPSEHYHQQDGKYLENDVGYRPTSQPIEHYVEYRQQQQSKTEVPTNDDHASNYATPQEVYQQEIAVGNRYQSIQQKAATEKYLKNSNKDTQYVNIPMEQLLSYYPSLALASSSQHFSHRLTNQANRQIAIPVYAPPLRRETIYGPSIVDYRIEPQSYLSYASMYPQQTEAILPTKQPNNLIRAQSSLNNRQQPQAEPHGYPGEIVYAHQPGAAYASAVSSNYDEAYAGPTVDLRANSLGQGYSSQTGTQHRYTPADSLPGRYYELPNIVPNIYQHQSSDAADNHQAETPDNGFDLPKLPAENFKSASGIRLVPVHAEDIGSQSFRNHLIHSSGPKSLLESYVPSLIIAAQDVERYRERPIKLERGFVPSKINFVQSYGKREVE